MRDEMKLILNEDGKPLEIIGYLIDISERKRAEQALCVREKELEIKTKGQISKPTFYH
jgi:PAS domain-containing protein